MVTPYRKDLQYAKFCAYGFLKNLRFFEPFFYLFFLEKGLDFLHIGTLIAIREVIRNVLEIPSGMMSDAWGRRRTMITSFVIYIFSFVIFYFADSYGMQIIAISLFAVADAFRTGTHKAMIFTWLELNGWMGHKVDYYGHTRSWSQRGAAVSSLLAALVVFWSGTYKIAFLISIIPYFFDMILLMTYPSSLEGGLRETANRYTLSDITSVFRQQFSNMRKVTNVRLIINTSMYGGLFTAIKDYFQPVLAALAAMFTGKIAGISAAQMSALMIGVVYFLIYIGTATASAWSGWVSRKFKGLSTVLNVSLLSGLFILLVTGVLWFVPDPWKWSVILPFFMLYLLDNVRRPVTVAVISEAFPSEILATTLSIESQTRSLLAAMIAPPFGFVVDKIGISGGLIILALFILLFYPLIRIPVQKNHSGKSPPVSLH